MSDIPIKPLKYNIPGGGGQQFYPETSSGAVKDPEGNSIDIVLDDTMNNFSDAFSEDVPYQVGDYCIFQNTLYKFIAAKAAGAWDSTKVSMTTVEAELKTLSNAITELNSNLGYKEWTLEQVNKLPITSLEIGSISPQTAIAMGIVDATDWMQVISIPLGTNLYPNQIIICEAGLMRAYYRGCENGTWQVPKLLITNNEVDIIGANNCKGIQTDLITANNMASYYRLVAKDGALYQLSADSTGIQYARLVNSNWENIWTIPKP